MQIFCLALAVLLVVGSAHASDCPMDGFPDAFVSVPGRINHTNADNELCFWVFPSETWLLVQVESFSSEFNVDKLVLKASGGALDWSASGSTLATYTGTYTANNPILKKTVPPGGIMLRYSSDSSTHVGGFVVDVTIANMNECSSLHNCATNAKCTDTQGSFICTCNAGYWGSGVVCMSDTNTTFETLPAHERKIAFGIIVGAPVGAGALLLVVGLVVIIVYLRHVRKYPVVDDAGIVHFLTRKQSKEMRKRLKKERREQNRHGPVEIQMQPATTILPNQVSHSQSPAGVQMSPPLSPVQISPPLDATVPAAPTTQQEPSAPTLLQPSTTTPQLPPSAPTLQPNPIGWRDM